MGFPSVGLESCYRNPRDDAVRILGENFGDKYKVWNLCSEPEHQYDAEVFSGRLCDEFQWPDHTPCTLSMLHALVDSIVAWLDADPENVALVHCKAGKGRTGLAICAAMVRVCNQTAGEAMNDYGRTRTRDGKGLTLPGQRRYVQYYALQVPRTAKPASVQSIALQLPAQFTAATIAVMQLGGSAPQQVWGAKQKLRRGHVEIAFESPLVLQDDFLFTFDVARGSAITKLRLWVHAGGIASFYTAADLDGGKKLPVSPAQVVLTLTFAA
jgi:hypothetical protein